MTRVGIDQHDKIVSGADLLDVGVPLVVCGFFRPLQHPVHLSEIDVSQSDE